MMRHFIIGITLLSLSLDVAGATTSAGSGDALDAGLSDDTQAAGSLAVTAVPLVPPVTTVRVVAPRAERQSAVGDSVGPIIGDARTADLFTVAPATALRGRCRTGDRQGAGGPQEGT
jgi:hypothetical protein